MLKLHLCPSYQPIASYLSRIDFQRETLIISNLRTQKEVQQKLMDQQGYFLEESVLRASHFWRTLLKKNSPQKKIISQELALTRISSFLKGPQNTFPMNESSSKIIFRMLKELGGLLHLQDDNFPLEEWLQSKVEMQRRLQPWMELTSVLYEQFLSRNELLEAWVPAFLLQQSQFEKQWNRPLWIDLAGEISMAEAEVFHMISRFQEVHILVPDPAWAKDFEYLLKPYSFLKSKASFTETFPVTSGKTIGLEQAHKFSNRLAEIKFAVVQTRKWIEKGNAPFQISILAADIEKYWPVLHLYLDQEGIPYQKNRVVKLASLPFFSQWVARLKVRLQDIQKHNLESSLFSYDEKSPLKYEKFKSLYSNLYEEKDLLRDPVVSGSFIEKENADNLVSFERWMEWASLSLPAKENPPELEVLLREILSQVPVNEQLSFEKWLQWFELILAQKEKTLHEGNSLGVSIQNLMAGHESNTTCRIFLGLNEEDFKSSSFEIVNSEDRLRLGLDLGVEIEHPDQNYKKFHLKWLTTAQTSEDHFLVGLTDFDGSLLNPNPFWHHLYYRKDKESSFQVQPSLETRWDLLQKVDLADVLQAERKSDAHSVPWILQRWQQDLGAQESVEALQSYPSLSPTSLMNWRECPFIFKAQKIYHLDSLPTADLETDPRPRGSLVHRLFELVSAQDELSQEQVSLEPMSLAQMQNIVEQARTEVGEAYFRSPIWEYQKSKWVDLGFRFHNFERQWRKTFPGHKIVARELGWKFCFDPLTQNFVRFTEENSQGKVVISGKIDRMDLISDVGLVVLDYKGSLPEGAQFKDWIEKNQLQLIFYLWVVERKFIPEFQQDVVAAFFYDYKNFNRDAGLQMDFLTSSELPTTKRTKTKASLQDKNDLLIRFEQELKSWIVLMIQGQFQPQPRDKEICLDCEWRVTCRASHLN